MNDNIYHLVGNLAKTPDNDDGCRGYLVTDG